MALGKYNSAIIGLDAQFQNQTSTQHNIDGVERALYLGKSLGKARIQENGKSQEQNNELDNSCLKAVERMAVANNVSSADIKVIVLAQNADSEDYVDNISIDIENVTVVCSLAKALQEIEILVSQNVLVALLGVNLNNIGINLNKKDSSFQHQQLSEYTATISFDQHFNSYQHCTGIVGLLFSSVSFAQSHQVYVYAWLTAFAVGDDIVKVTASALDKAEVSANAIGLLEVSALNEQADIESTGLISAYAQIQQQKLTTAISCARSVTGEGEGLSQVLGLLRTVIALQQRYIPAISDWQQPIANDFKQWQDSSFYLPTESRPWYPQQDGTAHFAAYSCLAANSDYCHLVLAENKMVAEDDKHPANDIRHNGFIAASELEMVLITADDEHGLLLKLTELGTSQKSLSDIALSSYNALQANLGTYTLVLLAESKEELNKEIQSAILGVVSAFESQKEWRTPKGSYFTPVPVNAASGEDQNITFLYPGIGATYVGLGRDLFHLFPEIHQDVANLADDIGASLKDTLLNPRTIVRPDFKALKQLDLNLRGNLADIAEAGVGFACVFTKVFENVFKVKADYATGYSMGEVSMYAALGAWQQPGLMSARLAQSDTFNHRLCGELLTLREHWGLGAETADQLIWETYTIKATLDQVIAASEGEERVYCTIINTPDSLLLAGYPEDCLRVIKKLGVRAMALNMANAIHSAPANKEYDDMVELYTMEVMPRIKTKMYSSSCYLPVPQLSKAIAHSVAKCLCDRVDFPRLVNTMHDKGARVFIEMGPGRSLCSWVDKILDAEKAHVSVPVNAKGTSDELTYFRAIAKLISQGVKLDLHTLFNGSIVVQN